MEESASFSLKVGLFWSFRIIVSNNIKSTKNGMAWKEGILPIKGCEHLKN